MQMNKNRKILVVALVMFGAIIAGHYIDVRYVGGVIDPRTRRYVKTERLALVSDVRMPLFVLAVFYVGLFSLLGSKNETTA